MTSLGVAYLIETLSKIKSLERSDFWISKPHLPSLTVPPWNLKVKLVFLLSMHRPMHPLLHAYTLVGRRSSPCCDVDALPSSDEAYGSLVDA